MAEWSTTRPIGVKPFDSFERHLVYQDEVGSVPQVGHPIEVDGDEGFYIAEVEAYYRPRREFTNKHGWSGTNPEFLSARVLISPLAE